LSEITLPASAVPLDMAGVAMPAAASFGPPTSLFGAAAGGATGVAAAANPTATATASAAAPAAANGVTDAAGNAIPGTEVVGNVTSAATGFKRVADFLSRNADVIGSILAGVGQELATANAEKDLLRERFDLTAANYRGADPGRAYRPAAPRTSGPKAGERFAPPTKPTSWGLVYDPKQRRMVRELMPAGGQ
jgi:hypothetical protein